MRFSVLFAMLTAAAGATIGCSAEPQAQKEDVASEASELRLSGARYAGKMAYGATKTVDYNSSARYRSVAFDATAGDEITIEVSSKYGDAVTWLTDGRYEVLAFNDDASSRTLDSKIEHKIATTGSHRIVIRDYDLLPATFDVKLSVKAAAATCSYDGKSYAEGASFASTDGCNTCTCGPSGNVACTKRACQPTCNPETEPNRNYVGSPAQCQVIRFTCQPGKQQFFNACGCGCEQL
jgi:hypothetical protein